MNAGFFPEEGKYNRTACTRCYEQYSLNDAVRHQWRCPADGGIIKKGVSDRAKELSGGSEARPRPPYIHVLPLAQIIQTMEGASSPNTKKCRAIYAFVHQYIWERDCGAGRCSRCRTSDSPPECRGSHFCPEGRNCQTPPGRRRKVRHVLAFSETLTHLLTPLFFALSSRGPPDPHPAKKHYFLNGVIHTRRVQPAETVQPPRTCHTER